MMNLMMMKMKYIDYIFNYIIYNYIIILYIIYFIINISFFKSDLY